MERAPRLLSIKLAVKSLDAEDDETGMRALHRTHGYVGQSPAIDADWVMRILTLISPEACVCATTDRPSPYPARGLLLSLSHENEYWYIVLVVIDYAAKR